MTLEEFAIRYKLKIKKDEVGDEIIPGKLVRGCGPERLSCHHHVYPLMSGAFAVYLNFPTKSRFKSAHRQLVASGAKPSATGDMDGILTFDAENEPLVKLVLKLTRVRAKRQMSEEQKQAVRQRFKKK